MKAVDEHCPGCGGWVSNSVHDEGYACPGLNPVAEPTLDEALAALTDAMVRSGRWSRTDAETDLRPVIEGVARLAKPRSRWSRWPDNMIRAAAVARLADRVRADDPDWD